MTTSINDVIALALTKVGYKYSQGPTRTTGADGYFDCSGFTYFLLDHLGVRPADWQPQSHLQALYDRDHQLLTSIDHAIATPGALLYEGPDHAYIGGANIPGHVAVSLGNGHTVEAMGTAWGTCIGNAVGRGWSNAGFFPAVDYSAGVVHPHPDPVPGPQLQGDQMPVLVPARAKPFGGRIANFALDIQSDKVIAYDGARLTWRMPPGDPQPKHVVFGTAVIYDIPTNGPHFGIVEDQAEVRLPDGTMILQPSNLMVVTAGDGGCAFADMTVPTK